jgi:hypothetical protein
MCVYSNPPAMIPLALGGLPFYAMGERAPTAIQVAIW